MSTLNVEGSLFCQSFYPLGSSRILLDPLGSKQTFNWMAKCPWRPMKSPGINVIVVWPISGCYINVARPFSFVSFHFLSASWHSPPFVLDLRSLLGIPVARARLMIRLTLAIWSPCHTDVSRFAETPTNGHRLCAVPASSPASSPGPGSRTQQTHATIHR